jgi:diguanylate cyclase (GGDEF)-like protein
LQLNYLRDLYESIDKGINGVVSVVLSDGTIMLRSPFSDADVGTSVAKGSFFKQYQDKPVAGSATAISSFDRIERIAGYRALDNYPLVVFVARDKHEVLAQWRRELAITSGVLALLLALLGLQGVRLLKLLRRQLRIEQALRRTKLNLVGANQRLSLLARNDGLTGLANRRAFDSSLQNEIKRAVRNGSALGVLMIDIDYFKQYNDHYGHLAGDACLRRVAGIIKNAVDRQGDVAVRYGGEEFALILPATGLAGVFTVADNIRRAVLASKLDHAGSSNGVVTISVGATAGVPTSASLPSHYIAIADCALYAAKAARRNNVTVKPFSS